MWSTCETNCCLALVKSPYNPACISVRLEAPRVNLKPVAVLSGVGSEVAVQLEEGILRVLWHHRLIRDCSDNTT